MALYQAKNLLSSVVFSFNPETGLYYVGEHVVPSGWVNFRTGHQIVTRTRQFYADFREVARIDEFTDVTITRGWSHVRFESTAALYNLDLILDYNVDLEPEDLLRMQQVFQSNLLSSMWLNILDNCCESCAPFFGAVLPLYGMTGLSPEKSREYLLPPIDKD